MVLNIGSERIFNFFKLFSCEERYKSIQIIKKIIENYKLPIFELKKVLMKNDNDILSNTVVINVISEKIFKVISVNKKNKLLNIVLDIVAHKAIYTKQIDWDQFLNALIHLLNSDYDKETLSLIKNLAGMNFILIENHFLESFKDITIAAKFLSGEIEEFDQNFNEQNLSQKMNLLQNLTKIIQRPLNYDSYIYLSKIRAEFPELSNIDSLNSLLFITRLHLLHREELNEEQKSIISSLPQIPIETCHLEIVLPEYVVYEKQMETFLHCHLDFSHSTVKRIGKLCAEIQDKELLMALVNQSKPLTASLLLKSFCMTLRKHVNENKFLEILDGIALNPIQSIFAIHNYNLANAKRDESKENTREKGKEKVKEETSGSRDSDEVILKKKRKNEEAKETDEPRQFAKPEKNLKRKKQLQ